MPDLPLMAFGANELRDTERVTGHRAQSLKKLGVSGRGAHTPQCPQGHQKEQRVPASGTSFL